MTIFDILHIPIIEYPVTFPFHNNRFYAYKELLVDLHNEKQITLTELTPDNKLFKQLNLNPDELPKCQYFYDDKVNKTIQVMIIPLLRITIPNTNYDTINYLETTDDHHYLITTTQHNVTTHLYAHSDNTHKGQIIGNQ